MDGVACDRHATNNGLVHSLYPLSSLLLLSSIVLRKFSLLLPLFCLFFLSACKGPQSTLDPASLAAQEVAQLWWGMFISSTFILVAILSLWLYAVRSNKKAAAEDKQRLRRQKNYLIIGGGILFPTLGIVVLLLFGIPVGHRMLPLPVQEKPPMRINVIGHQWWWEIYYPDAGVTLINELHLPTGQAIDIYATSADVIHSFWVPRLNGKIDMIPGHTNILRLLVPKPGHFRGQCAEFCGRFHARMLLRVNAHKPEAFAIWLQHQQTSKEPLQKVEHHSAIQGEKQGGISH